VIDRLVSRLLGLRRHAGVVLAFAVLAPLAVAAACAALRDQVSTSSAALLLVLVVVAVATTGRRVAALTAALASGVFFDLFLTQPYGSLTITHRDDLELTVLLVLIAGVVVETVLWGYRQQARAARRSGYLHGALRAAESAARGELPFDALTRLVATEIADVLGVPACRYVAGPSRDPRPAVLAHDGTVTRGGKPLDVDRHGLPVDEDTVLVITGGHFVITSASALTYPTLEQRRVAVLLADLVDSASRHTARA
jgi:K+-sensing histidine kinase KdpD